LAGFGISARRVALLFAGVLMVVPQARAADELRVPLLRGR